MGYFFAGILFLYLAAWTVKLCFRILYAIFRPLYDWIIATCHEARFPDSRVHPIPRLTARFFLFFLQGYQWLNFHFQDMAGGHLILTPLLSLFLILLYSNGGLTPVVFFFCLLTLICLLPSLLLKFLTVPLGLVRTSRLAGRMALFTFRRAPLSGSLFPAIMAWKKRTRTPEKQQQLKEWLEEQLALCNKKEPATLVCSLLLREEETVSRQMGMLQALAFIPAGSCPRLIHSACGVWLTGLAGQQGDWSEAVRWSGLYLKKSPSALLFFVHLLARRMNFQVTAGSGLLLFPAWLATCRSGLYPALRAAQQRKPGKIKKILQALDPAQVDQPTALQLLLQVNASSQLRSSRPVLHALGRCFEAVLADQQCGKNREISVNSPQQQALAAVEETLSATLSSWHSTARGEVPIQLQTMLIVDTAPADGDQLEALQYNLNALLHRFEGDNFLGIELEWQEWAAIIHLYQQCRFGSSTGHFEAYSETVPICWNWAAWLWNSQHEELLAATVFRWILFEAKIFADYDTVGAMEKNLR